MTTDQATQQILTSLARIETRLDALASDRADHEQRLRELERTAAADSDRADHEARIRRLEKALWLAAGAAAAIGGAAGQLVGMI